MTNEQGEFGIGEDSQKHNNKSQDIFSPVIVTEGIGTVFLGIISIILMAVVGSLLVRNRKMEERLREIGKSVNP